MEVDQIYTMPVRKGSLKRRRSSFGGIGAKKMKVVFSVPEVPRLSDVGAVLTFGQGEVGQLGLGEDVLERKRPAVVPALDNIVDICAGGMHTICLSSEGEVLTFGCNDDGCLGRDTSEEGSEYLPGKVELPGKAMQITAGDSHSAVLLEDGRVFAWGSFRDSVGNMGLTLKGIERSPVQMLSGIAVGKIESGSDHLVMLTKEGHLYTCGCGEQGQLGRVTERGASRKARQGLNHLLIPDIVKFKARTKHLFEDIWAGSSCTFAKEAETGMIYAFGLNNYSQLGFKSTGNQTAFYQPVLSKPLSEINIKKISCGQHHSLILSSDGHVYAVGRKEYGRLGLGPDCPDAETPELVNHLAYKKCVSIACGTSVSFAVTNQGDVYCWGMGTNGQLGEGEEEDVVWPRMLQSKQLESRFVLGVSAGGQHSVLLAAEGKQNVYSKNQ